MRTILRSMFVLVMMVLLTVSVQAQETNSKLIAPDYYPVPPTQSSFPFGQNHRYSVVFRGNGEAVVTLNAVFSNTTEQPLSTLEFRVPKGNPTDLIAFQVIAERRCISYDYSSVKKPSAKILPPCLQYQEPDINQYLYPYNAKYQKATTDLETDTVVVTLPQPVAANAVGSIVLYYRGAGYAQKDLFGGYDFSFESLKIEDKIQSLQVGISTDSDLLLKGNKSNVNYRLEDAAVMRTEAAGVAAPMANVQFDRYYQQIGQGSIVKTSSNLQPLDSYTVKGRYAEAMWQIYGKEIVIAIIVGIILLGVAGLAIKLVMHHLRPTKNNQKPLPTSLLMFIVSFGSAICIMVYTVCLLFLTRSLHSMLPYDMVAVGGILVMVISLGIYGFLLFIPAIVMGVKRGLSWGAATLGFTLFWVVIFGAILMLFTVMTRSSTNYPEPYYDVMPMRGGAVPPSEPMIENAE